MATQNTKVAVAAPTHKARTSFWSLSVNWLRILRIAALPAAVILSAVFVPMIWGWYPSYGNSYGDTVHGLIWIKEEKVAPTTKVNTGDNITYYYDGRRVMKRVWYVSPNQEWFWVMGDNMGGEGESGGSCEVGWICRPGVTSQPPAWPEPNADTKPAKPLVIQARVVGLFSPFDRRSEFEKQIRFFHDPSSYLIGGPYLVLVSMSHSDVYERENGKLLYEIPGRVTQLQGQVAYFLKPSAFPCDPIPGQFNLVGGQIVLAAEPKVAAPKTGTIDLRKATLLESSGQNPAKVLDGNPETAWTIGEGYRRTESLTIRLHQPTWVRAIRIDARLTYGTMLTMQTSLKNKERPVSNLAVNHKIDEVKLTLTQRARQPVTGQVKEVELLD